MKYTINSNGCWEFSGCKMPNGYGKVTVNKKTWLAHRCAYFLKHGEIPNKMYICHKCDNRLCINPEHLFLGTHKDNMQDMITKNRQNFSGLRAGNWNEKANALKPRGEKHHNCKHTNEQIIKIKEMLANGVKQKDIAALYNTSQGYISNIFNKRVRA
jgi:hypothetical protein